MSDWTPGQWMERGEKERLLGSLTSPWSLHVQTLRPPQSWWDNYLEDPKQKCVFCFLVLLPGAALLGLTTRDWLCPLCSATRLERERSPPV